MATGAVADLYNLADEYLTACFNALAFTPEGSPDRAFVSPGSPSWDCPEQLTVHVGEPAQADTFPLQPSLAPAHRVTVQGEVDLISMTATILRCVPTMTENGAMPTPLEIDQAAQQTCADLWAIWSMLKIGKRDGTLFPPKDREFFLDPAVAVPQGGGAGGWQIPIRVQLGGFRP